MRALAAVVFVVAACGGGSDGPTHPIDARAIDIGTFPDSPPIMPDAKQYTDAPKLDGSTSGVCNPLTQAGCNAGEKCTWLLDAVMPQYVGHIGCAPDGTANVDDACMYGAPGATGYDNCRKGEVCGNYRGGSGVCKALCDHQGGQPACDATHTCVVYSGLFSTGSVTPAAAGVCDVRCDPLDANDFDGAGTALTRASTVCGTDPMVGCYGYPSFGTPPQTGWSCTTDIHYNSTTPLVHRVQCLTTNGCADPALYVNSCNQGYLPLLRESSMVTTAICVALCKPKNCYLGNCGTSDVDHLGAAPHRCNDTDARGTFDTATTGEECTYLWHFEKDDQGTFLRSPTSDTVGFCFDHSKYQYDSNADNVPDTVLPACSQLQITATGTNPMDPLTYYGAKDLGCVDTATAGVMFWGKPKPSLANDLRPLFQATRAP